MRRFFALFLMLMLPLQFAWSAGGGVLGHLGDGDASVGFHTHDHDNDQNGHQHGAAAHDAAQSGACPAQPGHGDHPHDGHCHPAFNVLVVEIGLSPFDAGPGSPPAGPLVSSASHFPPQLYRPPLVLA